MTKRSRIEIVIALLLTTGSLSAQNHDQAWLGIPEIIMTDGGIGPNKAGKSTNYSATINLAAAFDTRLMRRIAENMGEETQAKWTGMK
ncbi:MAG: hypothetical protein NTV01_04630 [Bacteroidia bacterium]|nr:hypothetical protein [Bacteroidia bacterium]